MSDSQDYRLPPTWGRATLGELGHWCGGSTPSKSNPRFWEGGTTPWVSPKDMKVLRIADSLDHITRKALAETNVPLVPAGTVLIVIRSGILEHTLPVAIAEVPVAVNQDLKALTPPSGIDPFYIAYSLQRFAREILHTCGKTGTTVQNIEFPRLLRFEVPIAPQEQQGRIVAEIDKQFSRLDAGVAALKRVAANLRRYKASVLKAACEGRLTAAWRAAHPVVEPASELLKRILRERRRRWEESELAKLRAKGKPPKDDRWKERYEEPAAAKADNLPGLPPTWIWATLDQLLAQGEYGTSIKCDYDASGTPVLRIPNIVNQKIDLSDLKRAT